MKTKGIITFSMAALMFAAIPATAQEENGHDDDRVQNHVCRTLRP